LPNVVEGVLTLLGSLRAGLIPAPIPLLWRTAEMAATLSRIGARALISCRQVGDVDHSELAMQVAAETFAIRFVGGFGSDLPDGVVALDDAFGDVPGDRPQLERSGHPAEHVAAITFDVTSAGIVPVARSHAEIAAAGTAVLAEAGELSDPRILGALALSSLAGLATTVVPWLLSGGTLVLHQAFSPENFAAQRASERCDLVVVPGSLVQRLCEAGLIGARDALKGTVAVWRAPERLSASPTWSGATPLIDVSVFGEIGLVASRRGVGGKPGALPVGRITAPHGGANARSVIEVARTPHGTVALRGPMVPLHPFPPGVTRHDNLRLKLDDDGFIDTEYPCRVERDTKALVVNGAPPGIVSVGGYRFALRDLQNLVAQVDGEGSLAALPDLLSGQRLAGSAADRDAVRQALTEQGANPLLVAAFRGRRSGQASAA
jgi:AMP-binding enzyme